MNKSYLSLEKVTQILLLLLVIFIAGLRIWGLNKGFNITDEAYAVLGYEPLQERLEVVSVFHRIVYKLLGWLEPSLIAYRALGQSLTVFAASFFAFGFCYWLNKIYKFKEQPFSYLFILLFFILGGFVIDYDRHNILNYDVINNALNLTQASLVLILISQETEKIIKSWKFKLGWLAVGFLVAFQFLNKATSAIAFIIILVSLLIFYKKNVNIKVQYYLVIGSFFVLGGLLGLLTYFVMFQDFWQYQELLFRQLAYSLERDYSIKGDYTLENPSSPLITKITKNFKIIIVGIAGGIATFALAKFSFSLDYLKDSKKARLLKVLVWLSSVFIFWALINVWQWHLIQKINITVYYPLIFIFLLIILAAAFSNKFFNLFNSKNYTNFSKIAPVSIFLFFLPFVAAIGTSTSIRQLAARNIIPWLALIIILLTVLSNIQKAKNFIYVFSLSMILWLGIKISYTQVYQPYKLVENRLQQTESIDFVQPHARGLKVDPPTAKFLQQLDQIVNQTGYNVGDPIIALHDMPGLVYLLGGVSPGAPWYFSTYEKSSVRTCNNILYSDFAPSKAIFLINSDVAPQVLNCLKTVGINFPEDYQKVGEVNDPYYSVHWEHKEIHRKTVAVWSPREIARQQAIK